MRPLTHDNVTCPFRVSDKVIWGQINFNKGPGEVDTAAMIYSGRSVMLGIIPPPRIELEIWSQRPHPFN